jgi:hypothetical protein
LVVRPVRVSLDDFHHPRAVRYQQGRESPDGFWRHAFNYARFHGDVLDPFGPGGDRRYRPAAHDLVTDTECTPALRTAAAGTVLSVDGLFLHRDELVGAWDLSVFLDLNFAEAARFVAGLAPMQELFQQPHRRVFVARLAGHRRRISGIRRRCRPRGQQVPVTIGVDPLSSSGDPT